MNKYITNHSFKTNCWPRWLYVLFMLNFPFALYQIVNWAKISLASIILVPLSNLCKTLPRISYIQLFTMKTLVLALLVVVLYFQYTLVSTQSKGLINSSQASDETDCVRLYFQYSSMAVVCVLVSKIVTVTILLYIDANIDYTVLVLYILCGLASNLWVLGMTSIWTRNCLINISLNTSSVWRHKYAFDFVLFKSIFRSGFNHLQRGWR